MTVVFASLEGKNRSFLQRAEEEGTRQPEIRGLKVSKAIAI